MINAEMSRLSAREIAQRFLKSIMKQVGVLSSQNPDGDEDETIPTISAPTTQQSFLPLRSTVKQHSYGTDAVRNTAR